MKFYKYLNESVSDETINKQIQLECKPYLKMIKKLPTPLVRGLYNFNTDFDVTMVRKDRKPQGMDIKTFKEFNKWLEKNGHNRRDQSISCISPKGFSSLFGNPYWIFPISNFSYSWVETKDINMRDPRTGWYNFAVDSYFKYGEEEFDNTYGMSLKKPFKEYFHTDKGIKHAYDSRFEIWINCDEYYIVSKDKFEWTNNRI